MIPMTDALVVQALSKKYPDFSLQDVSFRVKEGSIMGFIGRNGAGKSTTLKAILNLVHPDKGEVSYFGQSLDKHELTIKQKIGFADGNVLFYPKTKIKKILGLSKNFYRDWDEAACVHYLQLFELNENKCPADLSAGMRVKFNLLLALSHHARLLILDEPTSGLDPVSRHELLAIFKELKAEGISILFSTHLTTDLESCADHITYIRKGRIIASESLTDFLANGRKKSRGNSIEEIMISEEEEALQNESIAE